MGGLAMLSYHFGGGGGDHVAWITHMVVSSVINGLIWSVIFRLVSHLTLSQAVLLAVVVIGGMFLWARSRDRARW